MAHASTVHIRVAPELLALIKALAQKERRTVSKWCAIHLESAAKKASR